MRPGGIRRSAVSAAGVETGQRRVAVGLLMAIFMVVWLGTLSQGEASHNTCSLVAQVGGEAQVEAWALASLNSKLPKTFSDKVKVGEVLGQPVRVNVRATMEKPAKNVDIVCASSSFSSKLDLEVRISGKAGSSTHNGDGRVTGHYTVASTSPVKVCMGDLKLAGLNLRNVQNEVDGWIRKQTNKSGLLGSFCVP